MRGLYESSLHRMWLLLGISAVLSTLIIKKTDFLSGNWGIVQDEIAIISVERNKTEIEDRYVETITVIDPSKSIWDGLQLLGVPIILVILGARFQVSQQRQADRVASKQREQEADEASEEVLQLFFDRISALLIDNNLMALTIREKEISLLDQNLIVLATKDKSLSSKEVAVLEASRDIIRARTLSILRRFEEDTERKGSVVRFLLETEVVSKLKVSLCRANLSDIDLENSDISRSNLSMANLNRTNLIRANLRDSNLGGADLVRAGLVGANLVNSDLTAADLKQAHLDLANLSEADLTCADFREAKLIGACFVGAFINDTDFSKADLSMSDFTDTKLAETNLTEANLAQSNLTGTDLSEADITGANLENIIFDSTTIWPIDDGVNKAKNVPDKLRRN